MACDLVLPPELKERKDHKKKKKNRNENHRAGPVDRLGGAVDT